MSRNHHDLFFKYVFGRPEHARGAFLAWLPASVTRRLDLEHLREASSELIDADLSARFADLLFETGFVDHEATLLLLHEHQHDVTRPLAARAFVYAGRAVAKRLGTEQPTPALICVVLHPGPGPWTAPTELFELYGLPEDLRETLRPHVPNLQLKVISLATEPDDRLGALPATPLARLAWLLLKHAACGADLEALLRAHPHLVRPLQDAPEDALAVASYTLRAGKVPRDRLAETMKELAGPVAEEAVMTTAEQLRTEGRAEGRAEGRTDGQQEIVLLLLRERFGKVTPEARQRVEAASSAELVRWAKRVLSASSPDEVFEPPARC